MVQKTKCGNKIESPIILRYFSLFDSLKVNAVIFLVNDVECVFFYFVFSDWEEKKNKMNDAAAMTTTEWVT